MCLIPSTSQEATIHECQVCLHCWESSFSSITYSLKYNAIWAWGVAEMLNRFLFINTEIFIWAAIITAYFSSCVVRNWMLMQLDNIDSHNCNYVNNTKIFFPLTLYVWRKRGDIEHTGTELLNYLFSWHRIPRSKDYLWIICWSNVGKVSRLYGWDIQVCIYFKGTLNVFYVCKFVHPKSGTLTQNIFSKCIAFHLIMPMLFFVTFWIDNFKLLSVGMFSVSICLSIFLFECRSIWLVYLK